MVKEIVVYPADVLRRKAEYVKDIDDGVVNLIKDMLDTMYENKGIGLAAPQIGVSKRIITVDIEWPEKDRRNPIVVINPEIVLKEDEIKSQERCLSLPGISDTIKRSRYVKVKGLDANGNVVELEGEDLLAIVFQHEIDHLDGLVFIDHLSRLKRNFYLKKLMKRKGGRKS